VFDRLSAADNELVSFTYERVIKVLDSAVDDVEKAVERGAVDDAELRRLQAKAEMREVTERLEAFAGALSELVISFATLARVPVTIGSSPMIQ